MKRKALGLTVIASAVAAVIVASQITTAQNPAQDKPATQPTAETPATMPSTQPSAVAVSKFSYGYGYDTGKRFKSSPIAFDKAEFMKGIEDAMSDTKSKVTPEELQTSVAEVQAAFQEIQVAEQAKQEAAMKVAGEKTKAAGAAFLEANKAKEGVKVTPSGLQYQITKEGTGASPKATDVVKVHYTGTLIDGTKFDGSVDRGQPVEFPLNGVIPGWTEGLQLLKVGGKARLFIPSDLGYGERGTPPGPDGTQAIGPGAVLVFDVELIDIVKEPGTDAPAAPTTAPAEMPK